jgi:hypothetical protein
MGDINFFSQVCGFFFFVKFKYVVWITFEIVKNIHINLKFELWKIH